ncbi:threonyl-tRNA synthetase [Veillonella montpellierensis DNF00314]|uniref:Threonine--tRNA ligase n=1 Tax=Veillonella montpellierensis DNF00314 TaxID=1401067 RepID=A0A096AMK1_9FIRM|nr:threonine--tRNA ligase [Veillonella montpellierensis]KGF47901.1 threonyl-tRNA synthetase [Veillonella montpellierensis DNF00314]
MKDVKIILPDGSEKSYAEGTTYGEAVKQLSNSLAKKVLAADVDGVTIDLREKIEDGSHVKFLTFEEQGGKDTLRHTASHVLADAIKRLWPEAKLAIGPSIEKGFYYDIDMDHVLTPEDLTTIEKEMKKIVKENHPLVKQIMSRKEALEFFADKNEDYKVELIRDLPEDEEISVYAMGDFIDLCAGPHVASTGKVKAFKLQSIAGAYWRGDEKNKMLQRIYGTAFEKQDDLDQYLAMLEEAAKRDHRKLGKELGLFVIKEEGPGFPFFLPKGMALRNELEAFWRELHHEFEYVEIRTPIILNRQLWETSGHWFHYRENMYTTQIDGEEYAIKPMNCPGGILVYKNEPHSYRDLPIRMAELGLVHRHELSGALHGLFRVRSFTQDDAHVFMLPSQMKEELMKVIELFDRTYSQFGLKYHVELSTKPENAMGDDAIWDAATEALREAIEAKGISYVINEGDGAFYGPKLDYHIEDSIGRTWQCGTIQLDMNLPERFNMEYIGEDGQKHRPVMIHRACFGSLERFIGILTEHFAGAFPTWMAPVQVKIMAISEHQAEYAKNIAKAMTAEYIRVEADVRNEKIGYKIRQAQMEKVPYMLVVGDKEMADGTVSIRKRGEGEIGAMDWKAFMADLQKEIKERR